MILNKDRMKYNVIRIILITVFFFWEIASSFSGKETGQIGVVDETTALSFKLKNEYSRSHGTTDFERMIEQFMGTWDIKGASVAITRNGKLVYARGFGYADEERQEKVQPKHLFRIASVSKLITAVAVLKLREEGKLDLEDKVFGVEGILNSEKYLRFKDPRVEEITVYHLLSHTAGWTDRYGDPMFMPHVVARKMSAKLPVDTETIVRYALTRTLSFDPGRRYSYSNLGYAVLGEVIEKVSDISYEDYVKLAILHPLGIYDMHIGRSYYREKYINEVRYYERPGTSPTRSFDDRSRYVPRSYGGNDITNLGAAGGWIASPAEIMKLVVAVDGMDSQPEILSRESIDIMTSGIGRTHHLIGWKGTDGKGTWWRTGTLSGSAALLVRQANGLNWFFVMNTTTWKRSRIHRYISRTMFTAINSIDRWPEKDLFRLQDPLPVPTAYITRINY